MDKKVEINKIGENGYIRMTEDMIAVFNPLEKGGASRRDRGDEINILMYVLNYLNVKLKYEPDLTDLEIVITHEQFAEMIKTKPIMEDKITLNNILDVIEKINAISNYMVFGNEIIGDYKIYAAIEVINWNAFGADYRITLGHKFIEYYKKVNIASNDYFKLYLDVMLSLSSRNTKILYAYLSRYDSQMNNKKASYSTNETGIDSLKFYFDKRRTRKANGKWEYKMQNQKVVQAVEQGLEEINKIIKIKREMYDTFIPLYKVKWVREGTGKTCAISKFRFKLDLEDMEQNKDKFGNLTMDDVFEEFHHNDCAIGVALYEYQAMLNRTQQKVRPITVRKMLSAIYDLPTEEQIKAIEYATDNEEVKIVKLT